jgi:hypothetical protein
MATPNLSDIAATTIDKRSGKIADNVTKHNALLAWLAKKGNIRTASGGATIIEEFSFAENGNFGWYSGYDLLNVQAADVLSGAQYTWKQAACPVVVSGLEKLQNSGKEAIIDLLEARIRVAESTMANNISLALYSDGTGFGGKAITGLQAALLPVVKGAQTGTYGGVNRALWPFWQNQFITGAATLGAAAQASAPAANWQGFLGKMNQMYANLVRGKDKPNLILADNTMWQYYTSAIQNLVRFTNGADDLGFPSVPFFNSNVVLDGGIGGYLGVSSPNFAAPTMLFLNTDYLFYRPHKDRNMVALNPDKRTAINQDAEVQILAWAGNMTCSGLQFQGILQ